MPSASNKVIKFHRQLHINVGIMICFIIFIYIVFHVFSYLTTDKISIYEVTQGQIAANYKYNALALRSESVIYSDRAGFPYYYKKSGATVGARSPIYAIDETGTLAAQLSESAASKNRLNTDDLSEAENNINAFMNGYNGTEFQKLYSFKNDLSDFLAQVYNDQALASLYSAINEATVANTYHLYYAPVAGHLLFYVDGLEGVTPDTFDPDVFVPDTYTMTPLRNYEEVEANSPICKIVTSDHWNLIMPVDDTIYDMIKDESYLQIKFDEDNATTWTAMSFIEKNGTRYLNLSLDDSADRYSEYRFITIELMIDEASGLKIPNTAITEKTFFSVPKAYFYQGNDKTDSLGIILKTEDGNNSFLSPTIYYETDDCYFIDSEFVKSGDSLIKPDSQETYTVGTETATLKGVYNVNKGYTVFKQIEILYQNNDYSIIKSGTNYGVALYDRIVLEGDKVKENDII